MDGRSGEEGIAEKVYNQIGPWGSRRHYVFEISILLHVDPFFRLIFLKTKYINISRYLSVLSRFIIVGMQLDVMGIRELHPTEVSGLEGHR
jgi:hypothetical protein